MSRRYLKADQWRELIAQQAAGAESVAEFCQRHGLTPKSFYRRRKALREADTHQGLVAVAPPMPSQLTGQIAVSWRGVALELPSSACPAWVAQLMRELADASVS
ncbi:MAG: hypothetical protein HND55_13735 [Pseudomonadota bacterium]|nr:MAG: hypothetical protein HND55_00805 [Pseudomonadota bacterium]QKK01670.1 MAG: hypothetical protein HND55_02770 [Pseudomonadota bacterium]QKK01911.1 MAG: hypothetical protein HND55_04090 [Pseudomonadota bacterium]QKK01924.1 MAG: hypothetical protein HND55_04160 [Pseudomonadota bacterium]QKK02060.1 MAG: hypothetical protein HND55_04925 [Pseudomonadota bacterium]